MGAGFTSGEGCFQISVSSSANSKFKVRVQLEFSVIQHVRDEQLISQAVEYRVFKFSNIENKILPFFTKYPIIGENPRIFMIDLE
ncbi:putative uncharacterized 49.1 kda protein in nd3 [Botrytis fragariae]|uniref:Uncharacterized 49.1 kDa protein in nd3 n=1 Tax=Botrytis fragariae TaxID=1964551 RepID=A0A8H6EDL7_9HELO|nr:putative uncharacterized 49.1 kda protein in nd3 [Botrytis fragariae]KAF5868409.1 putative uncharacterized 49.1 kda protein in nd3 [Botrytis fragariae]